MASERQMSANRRNGKKGGPKTEAGKLNSRKNAIKHGLTASSIVVLDEEDHDEYKRTLEGFRNSFDPTCFAENALIERLVNVYWRNLRSQRWETGMLETIANHLRHNVRRDAPHCPEHLDPHQAIGVALAAGSASTENWDKHLRYENAITRDLHKSLDGLMRMMKFRDQRLRRQLKEAPAIRIPSAAETEREEAAIRQASMEIVEIPPISNAKPAVNPNPVNTQVSENGIRFVSQERMPTQHESPPPLADIDREAA